MEQPLPEPKMAPKKKPDFPTEQFLRAVKHWTDQFVAGGIKLGIFLNSIQDDAQSYCKQTNRLDEWNEFIQDFMDEDSMDASSGEIIDEDIDD